MLENIPLFSDLAGAELARLEAMTVRRQISRQSLLMSEGERADALYFILQGCVKIFLSDENGKEVILAQLRGGEYFGEMALIDEQPRSASVMTVEDSELCTLSKQAFQQCLEQYPEIARQIMRGLVLRLRDADRKISSLALLDVYGRIAQLLLEMAQPEGKLLVIPQRLSQQDIANRIGASREMVGKIMKDLSQAGHIRVDGKRLIVYPTLTPRP